MTLSHEELEELKELYLQELTPDEPYKEWNLPGTERQAANYWIKKFLTFVRSQDRIAYDPNFGDDRICGCGHVYYRHFDTYEKMAPAGCKYCTCPVWHEEETEADRAFKEEDLTAREGSCSEGTCDCGRPTL